MKPNMGGVDRIMRLLAAAAIIGLYLAHMLSGTLAVVLLIVAGIFILTSFISFCPLYTLLGFRTNQKPK
ncbi:MAG: DUF2892 domain-containing protein [Candidatus Firestonebacteria bacterium]|nr:DUF2892 domain-containing protein [Candidatus Firestonebacteria bacterium]